MNRVGFFKRIWLATTDFRIYPYTQKERMMKALWYFLRLVLICALVISAFVTKYVFDSLPGIIAKIDEAVPSFEISNGKLIADEEKYAEIDSDTYLVFSKEKTSSDILNIISDVKNSGQPLKKYSGYILVLNDQASYVYDMEGAIYQAVKLDYINLLEPTTKDVIINDLTVIEDSFISKIAVFFIISFLFLIVIVINRLITSLIYAITIWLINTIFRLNLRFRNYVIIICYVSTLPIILETIAIIVTRQISDSVNLICTLVSFVYIFYGLRAIKIDNILSSGVGNNPIEKLENAIKEAQEEIEEQLKEKAEKEDEDKKEEKKEDDEDN